MIHLKYLQYCMTLFQLIRRDFTIFKWSVTAKFIDTSLHLFTSVVVFGYLLQSYGLRPDYGAFVLSGILATFGLFEVIGKVSQTLADLEGNNTTLYILGLPIPSSLVFFYIGISWALQSFLVSLLLIPIAKLFLLSRLTLGNISWLQLLLISFVSNVFFGFFALWLASLLRGMRSISQIYSRVINPLYMFGGAFYSWLTLYSLSHSIGLMTLINPLVYVIEGMRAAILGQEAYIPFWYSFTALFFFSGLFMFDSIRRFKIRLDCV